MIRKHKSTKLNSSKYCYVSLTIQLNISHLFTQLNDQTVLFQAIQFSKSHLFALSKNVKQVYLTRFRVDLGVMTMEGYYYSTSPKAQALLGPHHQIV